VTAVIFLETVIVVVSIGAVPIGAIVALLFEVAKGSIGAASVTINPRLEVYFVPFCVYVDNRNDMPSSVRIEALRYHVLLPFCATK
jgi:hypothetical protein